MRWTREKLLKGLGLVLLLCLLGSALLAAHASPGAALAHGSAPAGPAAGDQGCYVLDTTRPEWLGSLVYVPLIVKAWAP